MTKHDLYVRARALTGFVPLVTQLGGDGRALLARHDLTPEQIEDEDFSLPQRLYAELVNDAAVLTGKADFGIRLGGRQSLAIMGPAALVALYAQTVGEALQQLGRYMPYHSPGVTLSAWVEGEHAVVELNHDAGIQGPERRHLTELAFSVSSSFLRLITRASGKDWQIEFAHESPLSLARYRRAYGCKVTLGQASNRLLFPASLWQVPIDSANSELQSAAERSVRNLIQRHPLDLGRQVSSLVARSLASGNCTLPVIAEQLQMPVHTLKRRLGALDLRFEDIVDRLRRERVLELLPHAQLPLTEVTFLLGYTDSSSLTRACRRWFGQAPATLRAQQLTAARRAAD
ncbi:AraC family transcriptional regulator [Halopseudomonas maritima]|uniref:AraC family transcriptional regulator n=1 Tax=Halopseudomonas maritima TaxID=2918528 RepID=UPI001EEC6FDF|nr:AraC family transcriptional regulator [Halopseudomonas maritima]UJJ31638.1 AraC family transcriptional regulator ligand-binding domain-containing protein [Halopseudomonas maritima]